MSQNGIRVYKHKIRRELVMERGERASVRVVKELDLSSTGVMLRAGSNPVLPNEICASLFFRPNTKAALLDSTISVDSVHQSILWSFGFH